MEQIWDGIRFTQNIQSLGLPGCFESPRSEVASGVCNTCIVVHDTISMLPNIMLEI